MQKIVSSLGEVLQWIMGTSICESVNSAANIFLGLVIFFFFVKFFYGNNIIFRAKLHSY